MRNNRLQKEETHLFTQLSQTLSHFLSWKKERKYSTYNQEIHYDLSRNTLWSLDYFSYTVASDINT